HDHRPEREAVRANRGDAERLDAGVKDRPAGRYVVRGGAAGGGDDDTVADEPDPALAVGAYLQLDHVKRRAGGDDRVVQRRGAPAGAGDDLPRVRKVAGVGRADHERLEDQARADRKRAGDEGVEVVAEAFGGETGEETEAPEVDTGQGDRASMQSPRRRQQGA